MFQAWLVKIAKIAANSGPSVFPGNSETKNTTVKDKYPSTGTDCSTSRIGISTISARRLLAAAVAYNRVKIREAIRAASIRSVVRTAYIGRTEGDSEMGAGFVSAKGAVICFAPEPSNMTTPSTSRTAARSHQLGARDKTSPTAVGCRS